MDVNNVKSQMRKGMLEYCIMLLLHKEPAYASDIIQKLKEARLIVVEGTLYPLLTRLKNDDLLGYEWIESTQGPPRKYYRLTEKEKSFSVNWKCPGKSWTRRWITSAILEMTTENMLHSPNGK